ncbi:hypothetical protein GC175_04935 [bacterium]|nr:hypothetical protein [bacterium]
MNQERVSALEPWAERIVGEPVCVVRNDELQATKQAYGLATWNPESQVKEIHLDGSLFDERRASMPYIFYHECGHLRLDHVATGDMWHRLTAEIAHGVEVITEEQTQVKETQADEFAHRLLDEFAHLYLWDFLNGTLSIVDGEPVYAWDTDDIEISE